MPAGPSAARTSMVLSPAADRVHPAHPSEPGGAATVTELLGPSDGATHLSVAIVELAPGGSIEAHLHPFEESFFVLEGAPVINLDGDRRSLAPRDFGLVPFARGHAWSNPGPTAARWLRIFAPQPRPINGQAPHGVYAAPDVQVPADGRPVDELDPRCHHLGHFELDDMAPPGPASIPGYHGANVRNVQIRMMVDDLLGAIQHAMFFVRFTPTGTAAVTAKEHFHPFEEIYYILDGSATASFDGVTYPVAAGDLVFAPTGASHGFNPIDGQPVSWVEVQAPMPPRQNGHTFHSDWSGQAALA